MKTKRSRPPRPGVVELPLVPTSVNRHNRKAWVRSVLRLGDKWLLIKPVPAKPETEPSKTSLLDKWVLTKNTQRSMQ